MTKRSSREFTAVRARARLTTGEVIRMLRELKGWTQAELAHRTGISATNLSGLENDRLEIGKKRAQQLAKAFGVHPAIIMFPEYESAEIGRRAA
jgi:transcriptional regulator with XRE-family HTH domain